MQALRGDMGAAHRESESRLQEEKKKAEDRLKKLWDAYELQEREVVKLKEQVAFREQEILQKDHVIATLKTTLEARDTRLRDQDIELAGAKQKLETAEPKIKSLESQLRSAETRYNNVLKLWQASHESERFWKKAYEDQNEWFEGHLGLVGNLSRALDERQEMLNRVRREASTLDIESDTRRKAVQSMQPPKSP